jgi:hypothetical protein
MYDFSYTRQVFTAKCGCPVDTLDLAFMAEVVRAGLAVVCMQAALHP